MSEMKKAQKNVPATSITEGDLIFRTMPEHGDVAMHVKTVSRGVSGDGRDVCIYQGDIYKLTGQGSGENPVFLGDIGGELFARGEWKIPVDLRVTKGVPIEEADFDY